MKYKIHSSHMGIDACLKRARECMFWPGMSTEIKQLINGCATCRKFAPAQAKETLMSHEVPCRPWEKVAADLLTYNGKQFLITVDYYSNFWELDLLTDTISNAVLQRLKYHFARYGCPEVVVTDNGPQFACSEFARAWHFEHQTISPGNSQTNGKVESAVKTAKTLLKKASDSSTDHY